MVPMVCVIGLMLSSGCATTQKGAGDRWDFERDQADRLPIGWRVAETNPTTKTATWQVVRDDSAGSGKRVLALTDTTNLRPTFNVAIAEDTFYKDVSVSVRVKAVSGKIDQGGGPIWRCQDERNYYVCRINPLENNYRVYKVVDSKREKLASADVTLKAGQWYTLGVRMIGDQIACSLDGKPMLTARDTSIAQGGKVGFWTKADAVTSFDDLTAGQVE
jgi:hypothetical protein